MDLGLNLAMTHWDTGTEPNVGLAQEAERLGFSSVWIEEAYGSDAVSTLAWVGASTSKIGLGSAIWQIPARTPAMAGMTAATSFAAQRVQLRAGVMADQEEGFAGVDATEIVVGAEVTVGQPEVVGLNQRQDRRGERAFAGVSVFARHDIREQPGATVADERLRAMLLAVWVEPVTVTVTGKDADGA